MMLGILLVAGCTTPEHDPGVTATPSVLKPPTPILAFSNDTYRFDADGRVLIHGEVQNIGTGAAGNIVMAATIVDENGAPIGSLKNSTVPNAIGPGLKAAFRLEGRLERIGTGYALKAEFIRAIGHVDRNISTSAEQFEVSDGVARVSVNATNDALQPARTMDAWAVLRDPVGRVLSLDRMTLTASGNQSNPERLVWATFDLAVHDRHVADRAESASFVFVAG